MTCHEVSEFLMDYLDGALPGESRTVFEQHLAVCPECGAYLSSYESTIELGRSAFCNAGGEFAYPPPAELVAAILASRLADLGQATQRGHRPHRRT